MVELVKAHGYGNVAVGQHQWYHFGTGAPPILVYFSGDWDVHWGYGLLTHGHVLKLNAFDNWHCNPAMNSDTFSWTCS